MKQELEQNLKNDFPELFSELEGFQCKDGWFNLIWNLSNTVSFHCKSLPNELQNQIKVVQVKEKFGSLRYYTNHSTPFIDGAIALAESLSHSVCETCGNRGEIRVVKYYYFCACKKHFKEEQEKRK